MESIVSLHQTEIIEPSKGFSAKALKEVWEYRELLFFFILRDVKLRYRQTALGVIWTLLQPLATMLIFSVLFGRLAQITTGDIPYPLFAFSGLLPWLFFSKGVSQAANVLLDDADIIRKIYFPRLILPTADICVGFGDLAISFLCFLFLLPYYSYPPSTHLLFLPLAILHLFITSLGISYWLSALNALYRDVRHTLPFFMQLLLFISPVIYPLSYVQGPFKMLYLMNPLVGVIETFRYAVLGSAMTLSFFELTLSYVISLTVFISGIYFFKKIERVFADVV